MPCERGEGCLCKTEQQKVQCKSWVPAVGSTYYKCDYYHQYKLPCPYSKSRRKPCKTCQYYDNPGGIRGRIPTVEYDLSDPEDRKRYYRDHYKQRKLMKSLGGKDNFAEALVILARALTNATKELKEPTSENP